MSLDRFLAVVYAVESMTWRTEGNCKIAIALTWIICAFICTPLILSHGVDSSNPEFSYCIFLDNRPLPYIPEDWGMRWSQTVFTVSPTIRHLYSLSIQLRIDVLRCAL